MDSEFWWVRETPRDGSMGDLVVAEISFVDGAPAYVFFAGIDDWVSEGEIAERVKLIERAAPPKGHS